MRRWASVLLWTSNKPVVYFIRACCGATFGHDISKTWIKNYLYIIQISYRSLFIYFFFRARVNFTVLSSDQRTYLFTVCNLISVNIVKVRFHANAVTSDFLGNEKISIKEHQNIISATFQIELSFGIEWIIGDWLIENKCNIPKKCSVKNGETNQQHKKINNYRIFELY